VEHLKVVLEGAVEGGAGHTQPRHVGEDEAKMVQVVDDMLLRKFSNPDYLLLTSQASYMCCWAAIAE
jgi:hypothetical protein